MGFEVQKNVSLKNYNTFGLDVKTAQFVEINCKSDFEEFFKIKEQLLKPLLVIGGGSNILFTKDFEGLILLIKSKGIEVFSEDSENVCIKAQAGEDWDEFVDFCVSKNWCGLENLSLIPGSVGASVVQNIGAYGAEAIDFAYKVEVFNLQNGEFEELDIKECGLGYRESNFKSIWKDKYIVSSVFYKLKKKHDLNLTYSSLVSELKFRGCENPNIKNVRDIVIEIRRSKLPEPKDLGNAGSFFKNPIVDSEKFAELLKTYPSIINYPLLDSMYKLAAGWLIDQCGLKGFKYKGAAVHEKQALVLVNNGNAEPSDIVELSKIVQQEVFAKFGIELEPEVRFV